MIFFALIFFLCLTACEGAEPFVAWNVPQEPEPTVIYVDNSLPPPSCEDIGAYDDVDYSSCYPQDEDDDANQNETEAESDDRD